MRRSHIAVIGGALLAMGTAAAAQDAGPIPVPPPGRTYAFDVASVKPSAPGRAAAGTSTSSLPARSWCGTRHCGC